MAVTRHNHSSKSSVAFHIRQSTQDFTGKMPFGDHNEAALHLGVRSTKTAIKGA